MNVNFKACVNTSQYNYNNHDECPNNPYEDIAVDNDSYVRQEIRKNIERRLDPTYLYGKEIGTKTVEQLKSYFRNVAAQNLYAKNENNTEDTEHTVDEKLLKNLGYSYGTEKRKNELYSGAKLVSHPQGIKAAKEAGIKTIVALEGLPNDDYEQAAKKEGLNHICLYNIGNSTLNPFCVIPTQYGGQLLKNIIASPEIWATENTDGTKVSGADKSVCDLQDFIDILDGKNEKYPLPIYYGCAYGTNRTSAWTSIYNLLRGVDRTQPLDETTLTQLATLYNDMEETYKN